MRLSAPYNFIVISFAYFPVACYTVIFLSKIVTTQLLCDYGDDDNKRTNQDWWGGGGLEVGSCW